MFVVTGATGNTGGVAAQTLLDAGRKVRVVARDAAKGEAWRKRGAEVAIADFADEAALGRAFAGAEGVYLVLAGDDNNAFLAQAAQYQLAAKMAMLTEQIELVALRAVGDASVGLVGSARYAFTIDTPANKEFVELWKAEHKTVPDTFEGEQWQCMKVFEAGITKAGGIEAGKLRPALEGIEIESVKGKVHIRKCDHQGVQQGFMVEVVKKQGFDMPVPEVIATFPGESTTPKCNTMTYED